MLRRAAPRRRAEELSRDRTFWADLEAQRARSNALPRHTGGGFRNRRFAIIRDAAWITLYRAVHSYPQIGVFLRCTGLAGDAWFILANQARDVVEPSLLAALGPGARMEWGTSHHPGMIDIAAIIAAPLPWDDAACDWHIDWLLRVGAAWWNGLAYLAEEHNDNRGGAAP